MSDYTNCINILLQSLNEMVMDCDYKNDESITHKRVKNFHNMVTNVINVWYYELSYLSKDEYNKLDQKNIDIFNKYLTFLNRRRIN